MLTKSLFIGVGGSGGSTLRYMWQEIESKLKALGWDEGMPDAWQFLHIDAPQLAEENDGSVPSQLRDGEHYLGLAKNGVKYSEYAKTLSSEIDVLAGWRPDPNHDWGPIWKGAAQRRAVGRVITMANLKDVGERLDQAINRLSGAESAAQLNRLATLLGELADPKAPPIVGLISSLGGGAGAGMFLDVSLLLRGHATAGNEFLNQHFTVLYPADVFGSLPPGSRTGIAPNTLASLSEILSAHQHEGVLDGGDARILDRAGSSQKVEGNRTAQVNFFMGSRNGEVQFTSMNEIYKSTARGLTSFLLNSKIGEFLTNKAIINSISFSSPEELVAVSRRSGNSPDIQAGSSFGYSAVSLGRHAFTEYTAQRIARQIAESLMKSDADLQQELSKSRQDVDERARDFAERCQLLELDVADEANNQVLDALREFKSVTQKTNELVLSIRERFESRAQEVKKWTDAQWKRSLSDEFKRDAPTLQSQNDSELGEAAKQWVTDVRYRLSNETMRSISAVGLPETRYYLQKLEEDLGEACIQLEQSTQKFATAIQTTSTAIDKIFDLLDKVEAMTINSSKPKSFLDGLRESLSRTLEIRTRELALGLISDFIVGFLRPLRDEIERSREEFIGKMTELDEKALLASWSTESVADHLLPAPNERFLTPTDDYSSILGNILTDTFTLDDVGGALVKASQEVIGGFDENVGGSWPTRRFDPKGQVRLDEIDAWVPKEQTARIDSSSIAKKAQFRLHFSLDDLLSDARRWATSRTGIEEFTKETLSHYLNDDSAADGTSRRLKFVNEMKLALSMAEPMVNLNATALRYFHDEDEIKSVPVIGKIPLSDRFPEFNDVKQLLLAAGFLPQDASEILDENARGSDVEIARFIMTFVHPVVMDSVMKPLAQEWARANDAAAGRKQFWEGRRARTLPSFIPLAKSVQVEMAKGWQVARILGFISAESINSFNDSIGTSAISIWTSDGQKLFPSPLLHAEYDNPSTIFPALMESFMLAFVDLSGGENSSFEAYKALGNLGRNSSRIINQWISSGSFDGYDAGVTPDPKIAGSPSEQSDDRKRLVINELKRRRKILVNGVGSLDLDESNFDKFDRSWEMREIIELAIELILGEIESGISLFDPSNA